MEGDGQPGLVSRWTDREMCIRDRYNAEYNAGSADGCNITGQQCSAPMVVSGTSTYKVAEVWTTNAFNSTSFPTPNIYVGSLGTLSLIHI